MGMYTLFISKYTPVVRFVILFSCPVDQIPVAVPLATRSPSLDLTVTYDYTANFQGSPCQDNTASRRSEQFVALFPFAVSHCWFVI